MIINVISTLPRVTCIQTWHTFVENLKFCRILVVSTSVLLTQASTIDCYKCAAAWQASYSWNSTSDMRWPWNRLLRSVFSCCGYISCIQLSIFQTMYYAKLKLTSYLAAIAWCLKDRTAASIHQLYAPSGSMLHSLRLSKTLCICRRVRITIRSLSFLLLKA
jgi:hypothetical protein